MTAHSLSDRFASSAFAVVDKIANQTNVILENEKENLENDNPGAEPPSARFGFPVLVVNGSNRAKMNQRNVVPMNEAPRLNVSTNNLRPTAQEPAGAFASIDQNLLLAISKALHLPLRQISAPLETLKHSDASLSDSERKQLYGVIGLHAAQMLDLVDQLLNTKQATDHETMATPVVSDQPAPRITTPKGRRCSSYDDELLDKLFGIMEENLEETGFNVHKMCSMVHLSHMHLIRKVKQLTGKKPIELLKSYRLKRAQELLRQNKLNVAEVAYKVGYDMPNSFSRAFKKEFGISPSEFVG